MIRKTQYTNCLLALCLLSVFSAVSCTRFEEDDLFDESPALRIEHTADNFKSLLVNAPQGWVMQYFVAGTDEAKYEGFNLYAKFDASGKVTIGGKHSYFTDRELHGTYVEHSSLYQMLKEEGLVLSFNTWNEVLTPFVTPQAWTMVEVEDPKDPEKTKDSLMLVADGLGMQGDQNLAVRSYNDNEIIFRGERHGAQVRLVKADRAFSTYLAEAEAMQATIASPLLPSHYLTDGKDTLYYTNLHKGVFLKVDRLVDPLDSMSVSCCFTPTGFRNNYQDGLNGHMFQEFTLSADKSYLVNEDGTVRVMSTWDRDMARHTDIRWIDPASLSTDLKTLYDQLDAALKAANKNNSLARIGIGRTTNANNVTGLVVQWYANSRKTSTKMGGVAITRTRLAYGKVQYAALSDYTDNEMKGRAQSVQDAAKALCEGLSDTYKLTPEDYFKPSNVTFQSEDGAKSFVLLQ